MQVLLLQDVKGQGKKDQIIKVRSNDLTKGILVTTQVPAVATFAVVHGISSLCILESLPTSSPGLRNLSPFIRTGNKDYLYCLQNYFTTQTGTKQEHAQRNQPLCMQNYITDHMIQNRRYRTIYRMQMAQITTSIGTNIRFTAPQ